MDQLKKIEGPFQMPLSGQAAKQLIVFCHGLGSDGNDLIGLSPYFAKTLPDAFFVSPNAPFRYDLAPTGFQWFSLENSTPQSRLSGIEAAAPILNNFIDEQLERLNLDDKHLALVGFSQGTMLALHVGLRRSRPMGGIIGYSGSLIGGNLLQTETISRPPVLLVHGDIDEIVPPDALQSSVNALTSIGVEVKGEMRPGLGHGLDDRGIILGMEFLAGCFGIQLTSPDS